ncbi:protein of unknown function (plasmid) [Cupriavidus taiwanensis]|uniref:Uncharacterized protein n=1 Tax=Cupriavidus taiwanensis TaxID=164546 RepID=A0A375ECJ4_9BURK|nr:hypothetical protein CBM2613_U10040 [Cupriavidus taiwanensis]SPA11658.1 protein of unknown function [Cupriavidus taiwanensis]
MGAETGTLEGEEAEGAASARVLVRHSMANRFPAATTADRADNRQRSLAVRGTNTVARSFREYMR